jgi:hypothetical protein
VDAELKALIDETKAVTEQIKQAMGGIKNPGGSRAAAIWVSKESEELLSTLGKGLEGQDAGKKAVQVKEAKLKLAEMRKLLE